MHHSFMRHANMNKENRYSKLGEPTMRVTRARARALGQSAGLPPLHPSVKQDDKRFLRSNFKRTASDENKPTLSTAACRQHKKRAVLEDVANIFCENSYINCRNATKIQLSKQDKKVSMKRKAKVVPTVFGEKPEVNEGEKENRNQIKVKTEEGYSLPEESKVHKTIQPSKCISITESMLADIAHVKENYDIQVQLHSPSQREGNRHCLKVKGSIELGIADIDSKHKDPLMCGLYAPDIYTNMKARELDRNPSVDYMETLQRDITQGMRAILIDWLVEVLEEYRLVPDTLYLTVNLIDRFLSGNFIEKQKLQLLGVTCMLIASKYEEICAPRVEEFCFITDNTYAKEEDLFKGTNARHSPTCMSLIADLHYNTKPVYVVVIMESRVLNFVDFQLSVPTTKKFLRRFIQAAQVSYKVPSVELEFLANYLAELTLLEYSLLKFLPSLIAASAVFLARWTLDQSNHPWNPTLEHYTSYKAPELKIIVLALQDLQLNISGCTLNAIREKYKQAKFKSVATLLSSKPVQSLF